MNKIILFFSFNIYIRLLIQVFMFIVLSDVSEIILTFKNGTLNLTPSNKMISYSAAILFLALVIIFIAFPCLKACNLYNFKLPEPLANSRIKEYFTGYKNSERARAYTCVFLIRRFVLVTFFIATKSINPYLQMLICMSLHCVHFVYACYARPYKKTSHNIIEIINELILMALISILIYYHKLERWTTRVSDWYMYIIMGNCMIILIVTIGTLLHKIVSKISKMCKKKGMLNKILTLHRAWHRSPSKSTRRWFWVSDGRIKNADEPSTNQVTVKSYSQTSIP